MNPSRFYPKYLLAKLYNETGLEKAVFTANELLQKQVKIKSTAIEDIKEEMKNIIEKAGMDTLKDDNTPLQNGFGKQPRHKRTYHSKVITMGFKLQMW